jgi:hypothetical protein
MPFHHWNAAFSPDGGCLAVLSVEGTEVVTVFSFPAMEPLRDRSLHIGSGTGFSIRYSPCGRFLAVVGSDLAAVLDPSTLSTCEEIPVEYGSDVAFSPSGSLMAVGCWSAGEVFETSRFPTAGGSKTSP